MGMNKNIYIYIKIPKSCLKVELELGRLRPKKNNTMFLAYNNE